MARKRQKRKSEQPGPRQARILEWIYRQPCGFAFWSLRYAGDQKGPLPDTVRAGDSITLKSLVTRGWVVRHEHNKDDIRLTPDGARLCRKLFGSPKGPPTFEDDGYFSVRQPSQRKSSRPLARPARRTAGARVESDSEVIEFKSDPATAMSAASARVELDKIRAELADNLEMIEDLWRREGWRALGYKSWGQFVLAEFGSKLGSNR